MALMRDRVINAINNLSNYELWMLNDHISTYLGIAKLVDLSKEGTKLSPRQQVRLDQILAYEVKQDGN